MTGSSEIDRVGKVGAKALDRSGLGLVRVQHYDQQRGDGSEEQRANPPCQAASAFALGQARVNERQGEPPHSILTRIIHGVHVTADAGMMPLQSWPGFRN